MPEIVYSATFKLTPTADREAVKISLLRPRGTLYWGGAGLDGPYLQPQLAAFREAGLKYCFAGLTNSATADYPGFVGTFLDAIRSGLVVRFRDDSEWTISSGMAAEASQFNLIGYSYGSLLAALSLPSNFVSHSRGRHHAARCCWEASQARSNCIGLR
ncbi:hypothetical protein [Ralstonia solanacearum]|uniref:hypothetical protein n=1 Tax=Ralstonia solanacearum TaxID=305 RepID=UPI00247FB70A|nr:hypothetical protein [Ralstonia solanacearum]